MALFVIPVPAPAIGVDWSYTVPGQYIEHITAITAQLDSAGSAPTVAIDSGPDGADLTYSVGQVAFGIPGYVSVDKMVQRSAGAAGFVASGPVAMSYFNGADFYLACWTDAFISAGSGPPMMSFVGTGPSRVAFELLPSAGGKLQPNLRWTNTDFSFGGRAGPAGITAGAHFWAVRYNLAADKLQYYIDGVPTGGFIANAGVPPLIDAAGTLNLGGEPKVNTFPHYDEVVAGDTATVDADWANLYSLRGAFAGYSAAQLALGTRSYYHLDEISAGPQRQVTLDITDGTHTVLEVPTGFAESVVPATWAYSWQPNLNSSTQTPDQVTTTVAVPDLILPAGYTIGTRTLDLDPGDQWADIFIWWNSDIMDASPILNPIDYPPGAYLVIVPQGV